MLKIHRLLSISSSIESILDVHQLGSCRVSSSFRKQSKGIRKSKKPHVKMENPHGHHAEVASADVGAGSPPVQNWRDPTFRQQQAAIKSPQRPSKDNVRNGRNRKWEDVALTTNVGGNVFTVMSYNILAQDLLESHSYLYTNHNRTALEWSNRLERLKNEISSIKPDILCLQEVQANHLQMILDCLADLNFNHIFKKKTGNRTDGCAIFYNRKQFSLLERHTVEYYQPQIEHLDRENVAIVAKMCFKTNPAACFVISTTHLLYNPRRQDVRLAQVQVLLAELDRVAYSGYSRAGVPKRLPIILTGDFNFKPDSAPHHLITTGSLYYNNLTARQLEVPSNDFSQLTGNTFLSPRLGITNNCQHFNRSLLRNSDIPEHIMNSTNSDIFENIAKQYPELFSSGRLTHSLNLFSVYQHKKVDGQLEASTFQDGWVTVDYVFYSRPLTSAAGNNVCGGHLTLLSRYSLPSVDECHAIGRIPNSHLGSDHLSLAAKFSLNTPKS